MSAPVQQTEPRKLTPEIVESLKDNDIVMVVDPNTKKDVRMRVIMDGDDSIYLLAEGGFIPPAKDAVGYRFVHLREGSHKDRKMGFALHSRSKLEGLLESGIYNIS